MASSMQGIWKRSTLLSELIEVLISSSKNGELRRNFFTLNMDESSHLRECRNLPDATI